MQLNDIVAKIRGPEGTVVVLSLLRPDENRSLDVSITRGEIKIPAASWAMIPGTDVALIRLSQFSANALDDVKESIEGAKDAGAEVLIVDVRNNPGGLLEQAVSVTRQFLSDGDVLLGASTHRHARSGTADGDDLPLVVLINPGSASYAGSSPRHWIKAGMW